MDLLQQTRSFKLRKLLRYTRLYGPARTWIKVQSELHMRRRFDPLPPSRPLQDPKQAVGVIGCGKFGFSTISHYLTKGYGGVVGACMDIDIHKAASLSRYFHVPLYTDNAAELLRQDPIKLVYIASNHASHAEYAIQALDAGKDVHIEKPHVVSEDQLARLVEAVKRTRGRVFLGFNRPVSRFGRLTMDYLGEQSGPGVYSWFVVGMFLEPDHWYHRDGEGGRVLGNICHWTDFLLRLVPDGAFPVRIHPVSTGKPDEDVAIAFAFHDGTVATITYSAKGYAFEGVRERFSGQRGDCLVFLDDFDRLRIDVLHARKVYTNRYRDHGHRANVCLGYDTVFRNRPYDAQRQLKHLANTAWLFLKTKEALELKEAVTVSEYDLGAV